MQLKKAALSFPWYLLSKITAFMKKVKQILWIFDLFSCFFGIWRKRQKERQDFSYFAKSEMGAFSAVTLRVTTLKLPIPSFLRSFKNCQPSLLSFPPYLAFAFCQSRFRQNSCLETGDPSDPAEEELPPELRELLFRETDLCRFFAESDHIIAEFELAELANNCFGDDTATLNRTEGCLERNLFDRTA